MKEPRSDQLQASTAPEKLGYHPLFGGKENRSTGQPAQLVERLSLRQWIGISGAAFTTGLGRGTSVGKSIVLGLANIRLGYWWDSYIDAGARRKTSPKDYVRGNSIREFLAKWFPVQSHLFDEFMAKFRGPNSRLWYLSDGGHFENTAVYELIRRRVPLIIVCDCGADVDYAFDDLGQLVRLVRVDFGAEIEFISREKLAEQFDSETVQHFGEPKDFEVYRRDNAAAGKERIRPHALLARVWYPDDKGEARRGGFSLMLVLKPGLSGDESLDVEQYKTAYPEFPQESTLDQFFDDAQWESYRKLGRHIGEKIFPADGEPVWSTLKS
jgi:hypothetical protein